MGPASILEATKDGTHPNWSVTRKPAGARLRRCASLAGALGLAVLRAGGGRRDRECGGQAGRETVPDHATHEKFLPNSPPGDEICPVIQRYHAAVNGHKWRWDGK